MYYFFLYDNATGIIQQPPRQADTNPWPNPPSSWSTASFSTDDSTAILAAAHPDRYLISGSPATLNLQPYWTVSATESTSTTGQYSVNATLNHPPSSPPSSVTFKLAGSSVSASVSSSTASTTIALHPSITSQPVAITASASGIVDGSTTINPNASSDVDLQLIAASGSTPATVAPTGNAKPYLRQQAFGVNDTNLIDALVLAVQTISAGTSVAMDLLINTVLPTITQASWSPADISTIQKAVDNWKSNVLPHQILAQSLLDSSGSAVPGYTDIQAQAPRIKTGWDTYNGWVQNLPNLTD